MQEYFSRYFRVFWSASPAPSGACVGAGQYGGGVAGPELPWGDGRGLSQGLQRRRTNNGVNQMFNQADQA